MNKSNILIFLFLLCHSATFAQNDNLFVLRWTGNPYLIEKGSERQIARGSAINKKTKLVMGRDDEVILINSNGNAHKLYKTGTFKYRELTNLPPLKNNSSYTRKLMSYFIKEFTNNLNNDKVKSGVVYRGDYVELTQPLDNTILYTDEITFEWKALKNKSKPYYFVIKKKGSDKARIIGTFSNKLSLVTDNENIKNGNSYEWSVVESKYENLENLDYSSFTLIDNNRYKIIKKEVDSISNFLTSIGFTESEIETILCFKNKTCF